MIITFNVQNFRSIRDKVTLDLRATSDKTLEEYYVYNVEKPKRRILKMAMIYGANASGKTNVLLALDWLRGFSLSKREDKESPIHIDAYALDKTKPSIFEIEFLYQDNVYFYALELNNDYIINEKLSYCPNGKQAPVFQRKLTNTELFQYSYKWTGAQFSKEQQNACELCLQNQTVLAKVNSFQYSGPIQQARDWFKKSLDPIVLPNTKAELYTFGMKTYIDNPQSEKSYKGFYLDQLKKADFQIQDMLIKNYEIPLSDIPDNLRNAIVDQMKQNGKAVSDKVFRPKYLLLSHSNNEEDFSLDFGEESLGTQRYFCFIGLLCEIIEKNMIVFVDEIESSLHIDLIIHFILTVLRNKHQGQLLFTSHNTAILNERDILRRDAIWITDRKPDGSTDLTSVSEYPVRKEHAIDKIYRKGLIGGLPHLGSTLLDDDYETKEK